MKLSNTKNKNPCAKPEEPLTEEEASKYYDLDTFDENVLIKDKEIKVSLQSEKSISSQEDSSDDNGDKDCEEEDDESIKDLQLDSEDGMDIDLKMGEEKASYLNSQSIITKINDEEVDQNAIEGIYLISSNFQTINSFF